MTKILQDLICNKHGISSHTLSGKLRPRWKCKKCVYDSSMKYLYGLKEKALTYKGGRCSKCSYNKCKRALSFHHVDPSQKDFNIGTLRSWGKIKTELDKCILLCMNCHHEVHDKEDRHKGEERKYYMNRKEVFIINYKILNNQMSIKQAKELLEEKEGKSNRKTNLRLDLY